VPKTVDRKADEKILHRNSGTVIDHHGGVTPVNDIGHSGTDYGVFVESGNDDENVAPFHRTTLYRTYKENSAGTDA